MYLRHQIVFFWTILLGLLSSSVGLNVFDDCDEDNSSCPTGSRCLWRGCDGRKCICESNLLPSLNKTSCVKETPLGEKCKVDSVCVGQPLSECRLNTICSCLEGYRPSENGTYCVLVMNGDDITVEYGQYCDNEKYWCFPDDLQCSNHKCQCESGFRPATKEERYAEPYNTRYCRPTSFQLGVPVNISGPECRKQETLTTNTASFQTSSTSIPYSPYGTVSSSMSSTSLLSGSSPLSFSSTETSTAATTTESTTSPTTEPTTTFSTTTKSSTVTSKVSTSSASTIITSTSTKSTTSKKTLPPSTSTSSTSTSSTTTTTSTATTTSSPSRSTTSSSTASPTDRITTKEIPSSTTSLTNPETSHTTQYSEEITSPHIGDTTRNSGTKLYTKPEVTAESSTTIFSSSIADISSSTSTKSSATKTPIQTPKSVNTVSVSTTTTPSTSTVISSSTETSVGAKSDPPIVGVGDKCLKKKCPVNSECVTDACNEERCRCKLGYANSPDGKSCWKLSTLGEECGTERICQGQKTQCGDMGVCECENGYERSDSGRWCRLKSSWFIDFPVVGEECSGGFFSQCYMQFEQQCVNGKCQCLEGFREIVDRQDMDAVFPDIIQCRNDSFARGARDSMLCLHQSRESRNYDMYNKAKSKIRKIQGAIIGGCVGFVAMLGIVIGVVALVRWKRRGRREPIRDSSSTASTDATSRYSFKIPRPFTHFVGAKEYDSTQISYPNEVFEKDEGAIISQTTPDVVNVGTLERQNQNKQHSS